MTNSYLIDTCAMIWITQLAPLTREATALLSVKGGKLAVSMMSAWEIGMLVSKVRLRMTRYALVCFQKLVSQTPVDVLEVTPKILVQSTNLLKHVHNDQIDRILIATASVSDLTNRSEGRRLGKDN